MRTAIVTIEGVSPYCQGKPIASVKNREEAHDKFEERVWMERAHVDNGMVFIPPMAFKNAIAEAAKFKPIQMKGNGKATYTKHFEAGILVVEPLVLCKADQIEAWKHFVPSDGRAGGPKRVWKTFPLIRKWGGDVSFVVVDEIITQEVFSMVIEDAGKFIGIGSFRPRNRGMFGRFSVKNIRWE